MKNKNLKFKLNLLLGFSYAKYPDLTSPPRKVKVLLNERILGVFISAVLLTISLPVNYANAQVLRPTYTADEYCDAIFLAEGGYDATYLYGIRSVSYENEREARRICINTVRNNFKRYEEYGSTRFSTYLEFLGSRYCPVQSHPLNKYWVNNVIWFLENPK